MRLLPLPPTRLSKPVSARRNGYSLLVVKLIGWLFP